jgi:hypothetical protein
VRQKVKILKNPKSKVLSFGEDLGEAKSKNIKEPQIYSPLLWRGFR